MPAQLAYYRDLFENAPDLYFAVDADTTRISDCNATAVRRLSFSDKNELIGRDMLDVYHEDYRDRAAFLFEELKADARIESEAVCLRRADGGPIPASMRATAVIDDSGRIGSLRTMFRDCTTLADPQPNQDDVLRRLRVESLGRIASAVAHDVQNCLGSIQACCDRASLLIPQTSPAFESIRGAVDGISAASGLMRSLLDYASNRQHQRVPIDLCRAAAVALNLVKLSAPDNVELTLDCRANLWARADLAQIQQVLINLLTNAVEAIGTNPGRVNVELRGDGERAVVEVTDNGPGIADDAMPHLFAPHFTTKPTGHGLGLAASLASSSRIRATSARTGKTAGRSSSSRYRHAAASNRSPTAIRHLWSFYSTTTKWYAVRSRGC